nr:arginase family protein [Humibacillus sp. DSM 29435]
MNDEGGCVYVICAPSNLGLRPPAPTAVPGTCRAPEALRDAGLWRRLQVSPERDLGVVLPGRYLDDAQPGRLRNQDLIVAYTRLLADRLDQVPRDAQTLVLGGDCSILLAAGVHLRRRGRFGLIHLDGHTDYRNPANSEQCSSLAGEDLAAATGKHWPSVANLDNLGPYFNPSDTVHLGCRDDDENLSEVREDIADLVPASQWRHDPANAARRALAVVSRPELDGYWIHLDVDVVDPAYLPAVDSPDAGGVTPDELSDLLRTVLPQACGLQITVYDPDLDPDGACARLLVETIASALASLPTIQD